MHFDSYITEYVTDHLHLPTLHVTPCPEAVIIASVEVVVKDWDVLVGIVGTNSCIDKNNCMTVIVPM